MLMIVAATLMLPGCKTLGGASTTLTLVSTTPPGASVLVDGFGECQSPCSIEIDRPRSIIIAKAGYNPQRLTLQPGKKRLDVTLELSAPTTGVDEAVLPDL